MRLMLGLDQADSGWVRLDGESYRQIKQPLRVIGGLLDANWVHPGRSAYAHLAWLAASNGIPVRRIGEVLDQVGLRAVERRRVGTFSLGMRQRLGLAAALLGDPEILILDEPVNGLDPQGVLWVRHLMKNLAGEGRTVFVSSHLLSEMALTASELVIIVRGRIVAAGPTDEFVRRAGGRTVDVRTPQAKQFSAHARAVGMVLDDTDETLTVSERSAAEVGELAATHGIILHHLTERTDSLEAAFMRLTANEDDPETPAPQESQR